MLVLDYLQQDENEFKKELINNITPKIMPEIIPEPDEVKPRAIFNPYNDFRPRFKPY